METDTTEIGSSEPVQVKVSRLAAIAICLAIIGPALFLVYFVLDIVFRPTDSNVFDVLALFSAGISVVAIVFGIISFIRIEISGGKITGNNFAIGAVLIPIFAGLFPMFYSIFFVHRSVAARMVCGSNLAGIGKSMLIYDNDYEDELPRAGGKSTIWGTSVKWNAANRSEAYNLDQKGAGGAATMSASLYLLVKYAQVEPKRFLCSQDIKVSEFYPLGVVSRILKHQEKHKRDLESFWDFGPEPWKHNSFSYYMPYGPNKVTTANKPGTAIAADRNPWMPSPGWKVTDFTKFGIEGGKSVTKNGNTPTHNDEGQNVLFLDCHVNFELVSFCGVNQDNIYTSWNGNDIRKGKKPEFGSQPEDKNDSLLVNDPPVQNP